MLVFDVYCFRINFPPQVTILSLGFDGDMGAEDHSYITKITVFAVKIIWLVCVVAVAGF